MNPAQTFLAAHWLAVLTLLLTVSLFAALGWQRARRGRWSVPLLLGGCAVGLVGLGGLELLPPLTSLFVALGTLGVLALLLIVVFLTGLWSSRLGYVLGAALLFGLGGAAMPLLAE